MDFRLVLKAVTLNDLERRNSHYFALFHRCKSGAFVTNYVKVVY